MANKLIVKEGWSFTEWLVDGVPVKELEGLITPFINNKQRSSDIEWASIPCVAGDEAELIIENEDNGTAQLLKTIVLSNEIGKVPVKVVEEGEIYITGTTINWTYYDPETEEGTTTITWSINGNQLVQQGCTFLQSNGTIGNTFSSSSTVFTLLAVPLKEERVNDNWVTTFYIALIKNHDRFDTTGIFYSGSMVYTQSLTN